MFEVTKDVMWLGVLPCDLLLFSLSFDHSHFA